MPGALFVHAHPDDESIWTGGTIARYAAAGVPVAVVTCTRGEEGEVVPADLAHLHGRMLADVRSAELADALSVLGVAEHRFLGPYEDSGMTGTPPNDKPTAFWNADLDEASARLAALIEDLRPDVVVTYDSRGGYGHPDHIQAHRVTLLALELAPVSKAYVIASSDTTPTASIDVVPYLTQKFAAMAAHRTQVVVDPGRHRFHLADGEWHEVSDTETYALIRGTGGSAAESDLLAGIITG